MTNSDDISATHNLTA